MNKEVEIEYEKLHKKTYRGGSNLVRKSKIVLSVLISLKKELIPA
ncbi:hypothetical protein SAMN04487821_1174 [Enterococcus malodoratus]|nr:hypothetical protein [Enterococcus malodoratus]SET64695.1 hypothetical protein SAMN04487821_1174 [Enterococcus malodoratus]